MPSALSVLTKFSAPLLDRIDIRISVKNESDETEASSAQEPPLTTELLRIGIANAVKTQRHRQAKKNASLTPAETASFCKIDEDTRMLLTKAQNRYGFSPRATASILKIGRTIADMELSAEIKQQHIAEAIQYRKAFTNFMQTEAQ